MLLALGRKLVCIKKKFGAQVAKAGKIIPVLSLSYSSRSYRRDFTRDPWIRIDCRLWPLGRAELSIMSHTRWLVKEEFQKKPVRKSRKLKNRI
jgi:hypothetical protein